MSEKIKIAVFGLGGRGYGLLRDTILQVCQENNMEVAAVYDPYEDRVTKAANLVEERTGKRPVEAKCEDEILNNPEIKGALIPSAWEAHLPLAMRCMRHGIMPGIEVGGAYTLQDCWDLIHTYEETGVYCMLMENCCYGQWELLSLNMARQGLLGDVVYCEGGYHHDLRSEIANGKEKRHYRLRNYLNRNCENYPTHELGPIAKILDINNGNRLVSLSATASCAKGMHQYVLDHMGADHPLASQEFAQGDVFTTVIRCAKGQTIVLTLDTTLPRAYSRGFNVRGTKGGYFEDIRAVYLDGVHNEAEFNQRAIWENRDEYHDKYAHPLWKDYDPKGGHGGMDYLVFSAYAEALTKGAQPPIDVYDAATYMCITALSEESVHQGGAPVAIPDFTRGHWYQRTDIDYSLKYNLSREETHKDLY